MARQAEAEREKRAKIIAAEGEALSAGRLAEAADVIAEHPIALQLRNLQILGEIAAEKNSTIVFPAQFLESVRALGRFVENEAAARLAGTTPAGATPAGATPAGASTGEDRAAGPRTAAEMTAFGAVSGGSKQQE
ncbi:hypothetical protein [Streptacidiphilus anmyonensis]|uniref:hypothetical protein n=1 Tax=Streptacidiphilus anmyonensis TaxID=405782 RepID=UPI00191C328A|nr:hypothetical protein [Streptacidiphilus anmyonensis]